MRTPKELDAITDEEEAGRLLAERFEKETREQSNA